MVGLEVRVNVWVEVYVGLGVDEGVAVRVTVSGPWAPYAFAPAAWDE